MRYIKFRISGGQKAPDGRTTKAAIRRVESNLSDSSVNQFTRILHALATTTGVVRENAGFPYELPFELS